MSLELVTGVTFDPQNRRIPMLKVTDDDALIMKVLVYEDGVVFESKRSLPPLMLEEVAREVARLVGEADSKRTPPPPRTGVGTKSTKPKKATSSTKGRARKPPTPHPSHLDPKVLEGHPGEAPPGGWPKDAGIWQKFVEPGKKAADEYGKGGFQKEEDRPGRPSVDVQAMIKRRIE